MRFVILALLLALVMGTAQAYPLQGGNENVKATLFGTTRAPFEENTTQEILKVDLGLIGAENATFKLVDSKNNIFPPNLYKILQPGRQMLIFLIPKDDLFKLLNVTPTQGKPFSINWWATPKGAKGDTIIRYYGITDWLADPDQQALVLELRIGNNGTSGLAISPENFTLLDQWGWDYYPVAGFEPTIIAPMMATDRVKLGFTGISPLSRPALLAFDYMTPNQIIIDLEKDQGPLSNAVVYGINETPPSAVISTTNLQSIDQSKNQTTTLTRNEANQSQQNESSKGNIDTLKGEINASKERLKGVGGSISKDQGSTMASKMTSDIKAAQQRIQMTKEDLKKK